MREAGSAGMGAQEALLAPGRVGEQPTGGSAPEELLSQRQIRVAVAAMRGSRWVRHRPRLTAIQTFIGAPATAVVDAATAVAAATYQDRRALDVDGIIGPRTVATLRRDGAFERREQEREREAPAVPAPASESAAPTPEGAGEAAAPAPVEEPAEPAEALAEAPAAAPADARRRRAPGEAGASPASGVEADGAERDDPLFGGQTHERFAMEAPSAAAARDASARLTPAEQTAFAAARRLGPRVDWTVGLQRVLGVAITGRIDRVTIAALADRYPGSQGVLDTKLAGRISEEHPELGSHEIATPEDMEDARGVSAAATSREAQAVARVFRGKDWAWWRSELKQIAFLGMPVKGHPELLTRLREAESYLLRRFGITDPNELAGRLGVHQVEDIRRVGNGMHTLGLAFDINKPENPWVVGEAGEARRNANSKAVMDRAVDLLGTGEKVTGRSMGGMGKQSTTEDAFDRLQETNVTLRRYRALAGDIAGITEVLRARHPSYDEARLAAEARRWADQITKDHALLLDVRGANWNRRSDNTGFMDHQKELIIALRDVGGLAWGAIDIAGEGGDMQHFDTRTLPIGSRLHTTMLRLRSAARAAGG